MRKRTLARLEIYASLIVAALLLALAGYGLVATFADRLDPRVAACVARATQGAAATARSRAEAVKLCKHLEAIGALH